MKITNIVKEGRVYTLTFTPRFLGRLFGLKESTEKFKDTFSTYVFGGGGIYVNQQGQRTGNGSYIGEAIDLFDRRW